MISMVKALAGHESRGVSGNLIYLFKICNWRDKKSETATESCCILHQSEQYHHLHLAFKYKVKTKNDR
jgi:hypothetical protein